MLVRIFYFNFSEYDAGKRSYLYIDCAVQAAKWHSVPNFLDNRGSLIERPQHLLSIGPWNFILEL